jgi:multidrug efflux pump subunit AcrB
MQFGLTVAIAVLFSLLVARLITPLMAAYLMRTGDAAGHEERDGWVMRGYLWFVRVTMRLRYLTLLAAFGILGVSLYFMAQIPAPFIPPEDVSRITLSVELPPGVALEDTAP